MIANIINVLLGIALSYVAIFGMPAGAPVTWILAAAGIAIVVLAWIARRSDFSSWQSATNSALGIVLIIITLVERAVTISPLVTFWIDLWVGLTVASLALWATLYHPKKRAEPLAAGQ